MKPEEVIDFQQRLVNLELGYAQVKKTMEGFKIDKQLFIKREGNLKPGMASKISYSSDGLITGSESLNQNDIPQLNMDKIEGLRDQINDKASIAEVQKLKKTLEEIYHQGDVVATGCKVNVDEHGYVISVSELIEEDIPTLPISKIEGLETILDQLRKSDNQTLEVSDDYRINPGSGCNISYDEKGRVVGSRSLSMSDVPNELLTRLNTLESGLTAAASQKSLSNLTKTIVAKLDANSPITSGVFTKVTVDSNGLVTLGQNLSISDLPELKVDHITNLQRLLNDKADRSEVSELAQSVSSLVASINKMGSINQVKESLDKKANTEDLLTIKNQVKELKNLLDKLITSIPGDQILEQLQKIQNDVNTLAGRVSYLEGKVSN